MIVATPQIVGTDTIADIHGRTVWWIRQRIRNKDPRYLHGYLGKIGNKHAWNLTEALTGLYDIDALTPLADACAAPDCTGSAGAIGLCPTHLAWLITVFRIIEDRLGGASVASSATMDP
jgi:hypothetical protein